MQKKLLILILLGCQAIFADENIALLSRNNLLNF